MAAAAHRRTADEDTVVISGNRITIALAGNPNSGKTTLFNNLTGARQHVGNYPGVTVERKAGVCRYLGYEIRVIDLPGTYSLTAYSVEERVARDFLIEHRPDVVVNILDASNIERNLYLTTQLIELGLPLVLVLNMSDTAKARGIEFDLERLSRLLGAPIVETVGHKERGTESLLEAVVAVATTPPDTPRPAVTVGYGREINREVTDIERLLSGDEALVSHYGGRWLAVKLLEDDQEVVERVRSGAAHWEAVRDAVAKARRHIERDYGDTAEIVIADRRYGFISGACQESVRSSVELRHTRSDRVDAVATHGLFGLAIFVALMYGVFYLTFTVGQPLMDVLEWLFGCLGDAVAGLWPADSDSPLKSLLIDGVIGGVGGVLVFLPNIILLFAAIAFLEDSGYMARAAFIMDRLMHKIGLHGKSFIPMLIGFGCTVPAVMATRILDSRRDRLVTMLVLPLVSCGARLPIYALLIPAFFSPHLRAPMLLAMYVIGIALAVVGVKLLRTFVFKGDSAPLVMELPPYRMPTLKGVVIHTWERASAYLRKASTIILAFSVLMWALATYPRKTHLDRDYEAEIARAAGERNAALADLNAELGLPPESALLVADDLDASAAPHHAVRLVHLRQAIQAARQRFDEAVADEQLRADSSRYHAVQTHHLGELHRLQQTAPELYPLALRLLDEIQGPHERHVAQLEAARSAELLAASSVGRLGRLIEPLLKPLGFDWKIGTALIGAVAGKELFVAQMGIVYAVGDSESAGDALRAQLRNDYSPLVGFCIMLFCLVSMPCVATFAVTARESGRIRWAVFQAAGLTATAYVVTLAAYQLGTLLGLGS